MTDDDIAIVGVGCRFPGADNLDEFWRVLVNGENHVKEIPLERWNHEAFYDADPNEPGKIYTKRAGLLNRFDEWDNRVFSISEAEAERMDPQQKHVLECVHMAMEDGGFTRTQLNGSSTGVYIGSMNDDYKSLASSDHTDDSSYGATGMSTSVIAARVSYVYNLLGPCLALDTACSSALIAIHLGCQAIKSGDCELSICGGVSSIVSPDTFMALCAARMMSATGQCQAFTDTADGYARGEGCGMVILKKLKQAEADGNNIWAVIKTGTNQDGRMANPMTAPSGYQQGELLKRVYTQYQVDPALVQYIEAHGTGTSIGDPTEVNSLGSFFSKYNDQTVNTSPLLIGSVKTNIGHTESAAGVAGLIKVLLMMKYGKIVPSLHVKKDKSNLNPKIKLDEYGLDIALGISDWNPNERGDRVSCVNSFGFGGSNSHAIIIQKRNFASAKPEVKNLKAENTISVSDGQSNHVNEVEGQLTSAENLLSNVTGRNLHIVCLSAADKIGLENTLDGLAEEMKASSYQINDIAYTSSCHRDHFTYRVGLVSKDSGDLIDQCTKVKSTIETLKPTAKRKVIFVFCGVGTTWTGMCKEMMRTESVFRETIERIDEHLQPLTNWYIGDKFLADTDYSDPFLNHIAIFSVQVGLSELWKSWGVVPDVIIGQSVGEVAAAFVSGGLNLKDAVKVIYYRSKHLAKQTGGAMMVVGNYDVEKLEKLCADNENKVVVAVYSSPTACTLSGDRITMQKIKETLEKEAENENFKILLKELDVKCAYHSSQVDSCRLPLKKDLGVLSEQNVKLPIISTVTGKIVSDNTFQFADYWADNVRMPVLFMQSIKSASDSASTNIFLEIGPKQVLRAHLPTFLDHKLNIALPSMGYQKESIAIFQSLSVLYQMGCTIDWENFYMAKGCIIPIPKYKFNKSKMLYVAESQQRYFKGLPSEESGTGQHMFIRSAVSENASYKMIIDKKTTAYVYDHFLHNTILLPGATYVEAAFEIGHRDFPYTAYELAVSVEFMNPFTPSGDQQYQVEIETDTFKTDSPIQFTAMKDKRVFAEGTIFQRTTAMKTSVDIDEIRQICTRGLTKEESYACLEDFGFKYGESLSLISRSWSSGSECLAEIIVPNSVQKEMKSTHLHPAIIDAVFQTFGILSIRRADDIIGDEVEQGPTLPKGVGSFLLNCPPQREMFIYAKETKKTKSGNHYNALLLAPNGNVIAEVDDFYTRTITMSVNETDQDLVYELTWNKLNLKNTNDIKKGKDVVLCLGRQHFISSINAANPQLNFRFFEILDLYETDSVFINALSELDRESISSIVFAPIDSVNNNNEEGKIVFQEAKLSFLAMKDLLICLKDKEVSVPVMVVTECTQNVPSREGKCLNIHGSELWGLIRSAIREDIYPDLRIIDIDLSAASIHTFCNLLLNEAEPKTEYVIESGNLFISNLVSYPRGKLENDLRDITVDTSEIAFLKSANPRRLELPHFRLPNLMKDSVIDQSDGVVRIQPTNICLHDRSIYPVTSGQSEGIHSIWPETNAEGFQMLAIEGSGYLSPSQENNKRNLSFDKSQKVLFCSPCRVASTISVPKECTLKETLLPYYKPGMITSSVIVSSLIESDVEISSTIAVVCDNSTAYLARMAADLIGTHKGCFGVVVCKENLSSDITDKSVQLQYVRSAVLLTTLTLDQIHQLLSQLKTLDKITTLKNLMPRDLYRQIVPDISVQAMEMENMFMEGSLRKKVPKVVKWLRSLDKDFWLNIAVACHYDASFEPRGGKNAYMFPYQTFRLSEEVELNCKNNLEKYRGNAIQNIPLRVTKPNFFRQNGIYILIGGLTGLGWELLVLMAEMGAGYLVTFSRRAPNDSQQKAIEDLMFRYDCKIICVQTDITDYQKLKQSFNELRCKFGSIPVRGVLQGGGVLADSLLTKMSKEQIEIPMLPKILGTWHLHLLTKDIEMDFFIMHSSIVSLFGNKGQCNYGSGNAFMDSLAHYRRGLGLCGQSINWGALGVGMAVQDPNVEKTLNLQGINLLNRYDIRTCFMYALMTNAPQICFGNFDWGKMSFFGPYPSNLTSLIEHAMHVQKPGSISSGKNILDLNAFKSLSDEEKTKTMFELVVGVVCDVFVVEKDSLEPETTFISLGIDSMAGMTFVNVAFDRTQCRIPIVNLLADQTTLGSITQYLIENLNYDSDEQTNAENIHSRKWIFGKIPFMQQVLLQEYVQDPDNPYWVRMADLEIKGIRIAFRSWKAILNHLLKINTELRRIYHLDSEDGDFDSYIVPEKDAKVELERVSVQSLRKEASETDIRQGQMFDLRTEFPIRFQLAIEGDCSILRLCLHAVACDVATLAMIFQDIAVITEKYAKRKRLPENKPFVDVNAVIQKILQPRLDELQNFWKEEFSADIPAVSFYHSIEKPDGAYFIKMEQTVPQHITDMVIRFAQKNGITWFQYVVSLYQFLLYQRNPQNFIPVCTPVDMRIHAPELRRVITRCVNTCPLVADFTDDLSIKDFIKKNSEKIQNATQYSAYPFPLIQEFMRSDELKGNINRHSVVMDNVTDLNATRKHDQVKVSIRNVWHIRTKYEFTAAFKFDQKTSKLVIEYGFNSKLCGLQYGALIPNRLMMLMERCITHSDAKVSDEVLIITDDDLGDTIPTVMANIPGAVSDARHKKTKEKRSSIVEQLTRVSHNTGLNDEQKIVSETHENGGSPTEGKSKSFLGYLRRLSKGNLEDLPSSDNIRYKDGNVKGELYKKIENGVNLNVHNDFVRNELNGKLSNKDVVSNKLINTDNSEIEPHNLNSTETAGTEQVLNNENHKLKNELAKRPSKSSLTDKDVDVALDTNQDTEKEQDIFVLKSAYFLKQTTQGWDHRVHVTLQQETSSREYHDLYLLWGKSETKKTSRLDLKTISDIQMMKINVHYSLMLRAPERWFVLKTLDKTQAEDWMSTIKTALEETVAPIY